MLVLSRKLDETIQIGDSITVTVVGIQNGRVKIGIDAPPEVSIRRGELDIRVGEGKRSTETRTVCSEVEGRKTGRARKQAALQSCLSEPGCPQKQVRPLRRFQTIVCRV